MKLKIITQERVVFNDDVDEIYTKGIDGEFGIFQIIPYYIFNFDSPER